MAILPRWDGQYQKTTGNEMSIVKIVVETKPWRIRDKPPNDIFRRFSKSKSNLGGLTNRKLFQNCVVGGLHRNNFFHDKIEFILYIILHDVEINYFMKESRFRLRKMGLLIQTIEPVETLPQQIQYFRKFGCLYSTSRCNTKQPLRDMNPASEIPIQLR
jgi:hypothetical protein